MPIDKALHQAPLGLDPMMGESMEPDIEIEIEDPESVGITAGGMEIMIEPGADIESEEFNANLAEDIPDDILAEIAGDLISEYEEDVSSRKDWMQTYVDGLELLGMKIEERSEPWEGACGVYHPLLSEALVKFQSETIMAFPLVVALIAAPILIQSYGIFAIAYAAAWAWKVPHKVAAPCALIGTSNFFELAVAVAISLFGLNSGAALATVVGVLVEVPVMLTLVAFANRTRAAFPAED